ncbi:hypothetical protein SLS60_004281 [Paraconiothyrium brasiliense]|uniref:Uncharacterized protein n=1 Tax=Paraconiothyrium brasiliense TaxID=300254 RepID=A0ABR3RJW9_9PLEO
MDGSVLIAPIEVGPQTEARTLKSENTDWVASDDFIFGYRLSRIKVKRNIDETTETEYTKGALYNHGSEDSGKRVAQYELEKVTGDDFVEAEDFGDSMVKVSDEDEECRCIIPRDNV